MAIIDRKARSIARTLVGPGPPVWSVAFLPDNTTLLTGGADGTIRRWNVLTGDPIGSSDRRHAGRSAGGLRRRSRRRSVQGLLSPVILWPKGTSARRPDTCRPVRPQDRIAARLPLFRCAEGHGHRVDAGDRRKTVRSRPERLHARHQDAGAAHRLGGRSQGAHGFPGARDLQIAIPWFLACADNRRSCAAARARERRRTDRTAVRSW